MRRVVGFLVAGLAVILVFELGGRALELPTPPSAELGAGRALAAAVFQTEPEAELLSVDTLSEGTARPWGLVLRWKPRIGALDQASDERNKRLCARVAGQPPALFQSVIIAAVQESGLGIGPFAVSTRAVQYCVWGVSVEPQEVRQIIRGLSSR